MHTQWTEAAIHRVRGRTSLAQEITDNLRRRIVSGDLRGGHRLPSVRKLASLYGVSAPTMQAALNGVVSLGLVRVARGVGLYVSGPRSDAALLNHACQYATPTELAIMRAAMDERLPGEVARRVKAGPPNRMPRTLSDIQFFAGERSVQRMGYPLTFLRADVRFHRSVAQALRGAEVAASTYARIMERLLPALMTVADVQAADRALDGAHLHLAVAILDGDERAAKRLGHAVAGRELQSLESTLG